MNYTMEQLKTVVQNSKNYSEMFRNLGYKSRVVDKIVRERILKEVSDNGFDVSHLDKARIQDRRNAKYKLEDILIKNSPYRGAGIKDRLFKEGLLKNECSECGLVKWRGKVITLQLDHINGDNTDNRIENLRILCANCHTLTPTYAGKNQKRVKKEKPLCSCGNSMKTTSKICKTCQDKAKETVNWPPDEELFSLVRKIGVKKAAIKCGCWSHNLIHRLTKRNFDYTPYYRPGYQPDLLAREKMLEADF